MTFHPSQVTSPLQNPPGGTARIAGHNFPGLGTNKQKIAALERAMLSNYAAIDALAREVERLGRQTR
jgi:hypothetical protein